MSSRSILCVVVTAALAASSTHAAPISIVPRPTIPPAQIQFASYERVLWDEGTSADLELFTPFSTTTRSWGPYTLWQAVGTANNRVLWAQPNGTTNLWTIDDTGNYVLAHPLYGPAGYHAVSLSPAADSNNQSAFVGQCWTHGDAETYYVLWLSESNANATMALDLVYGDGSLAARYWIAPPSDGSTPVGVATTFGGLSILTGSSSGRTPNWIVYELSWNSSSATYAIGPLQLYDVNQAGYPAVSFNPKYNGTAWIIQVMLSNGELRDYAQSTASPYGFTWVSHTVFTPPASGFTARAHAILQAVCSGG
jgi:hypothetical protein